MLNRTAVIATIAITLSNANPISLRSDIPKDQEFALALKAEGYPFLSLNIADIAAAQSQVIFQRPSAYPGTPAFLKDNFLQFDVGTETPYSMSFPNIGDNYGYKTPVYATVGGESGRDGFSISGQQLYATQTAALQHFFACNTTVNSEPILGLFWGVYKSDGTPPEDCVAAEIVQNFNIPGGAKPQS